MIRRILALALVAVALVAPAYGQAVPGENLIYAIDGRVSAPSFTFANDRDSGLYRIGANNIGIALNGAIEWNLTTTAFSPGASDGSALGTASLMWSDAFLASGGVLNWNNGDVTATHSANTLAFAGASSGYTFDAIVSPAASDGAPLGSGTVMWSDLFLASGSVINLNNGDVTLTHSSDTLTLAGGVVVVPNGSSGAPSIAFTNSVTTGFYSGSAGETHWASGGSLRHRLRQQDYYIFNDAAALVLDSSSGGATAVLTRDADNVLAVRDGTAAQRFNVANTYTSATNNELFSVDWQTIANTAIVGTRTATTGTSRRMALVSQGSSAGASSGALIVASSGVGLPFVRAGFYSTTDLSSVSTTGVAGTFVSLAEASSTATTGQIYGLAIVPTYNQASGDAANTDLRINRTETAIGSGTQRLIDAQVGGSSRFNVSNLGVMAFARRATVTVDAATTFAASATYIVLECTGAESIDTITGGTTGAVVWIENSDTDCTINDDDASTAANAIDLTGTATNDVGAAAKVIGLIYNGTHWLQMFESDN